MKKLIAVAAVIGLAVGLTWAAEQLGGWLGFAQQETVSAENQPAKNEDASPRNEGVPPSSDTTIGAQVSNEDEPAPQPELSAEVSSIEEDLARIEEALNSDEVLDEFTPSEPLSADNPIPMPTDI